ncbi:MAG TPA: ABC transporter ATP-binding protein [Actinomycetota bacterium]
MPDVPAVRAREVRKHYGATVALDGVDLTVDHGEVFGLLGPNGAGKTTLCEILEGHRLRDGGEVRVLGYDPAEGRQEFKDRIGVVLQEAGHPPTMTVIEAVRVFSAPYPHPRQPEEVLDLVGLSEKVGARIKTLSGGQKRRLDLALGIAGDPDLIFLDEPTTGFDPSARRRSWELVANLRKLGKTILLTTHYMDEAQTLADRVAVIAAGRIAAEGTPETIGGRDVAKAVVEFRLPPGVEPSTVPLPGAADLDIAPDGRIRFTTETPTRDLAALTAWAAGRGEELDGLTVARPSLEDVYLRLTAQAQSRDAGTAAGTDEGTQAGTGPGTDAAAARVPA